MINLNKHLMLDIETMGNESFSAILSIGAVEFDINTGWTGKEFHIYVEPQSCINLGLIINPSTFMWWLGQNEEARKRLITAKKVDIKTALENFNAFCDTSYEVWGNSARFDCGILQNAYNKAGIPIPWDFRKERCLRTLVSLEPGIQQDIKKPDVQHDAIQDCYYQIDYAVKTWKYLKHKQI